MVLENTVIENCGENAVFADDEAILEIRDCTLRNRTGTGVYVDTDADVEILESTVIESCAVQGVYADEGANLKIDESTIRDNAAEGLYAAEANLDLYGIRFQGNGTGSGDPAEVRVYGRATKMIEIDSCYFGGRTGDSTGIGFFYQDDGMAGVDGDTLKIGRCTFMYLETGIEFNQPDLLIGGDEPTRIDLGEGSVIEGDSISVLDGNEILHTETAFMLSYPRFVDIRTTAVMDHEVGVWTNKGTSAFGRHADETSGFNCFASTPGSLHVTVEGLSPNTFTANYNYWEDLDPSCVADSFFESTGFTM